jgi:hypothetical protein
MTRRDVPGVVYLLHFDQPIGNTASRTGYAQHYTGWAADLMARLDAHRSHSDVKIMQAVRAAGVGWALARTWQGSRNRERQIKNQGGASRYCPVCKGRPAQAIEVRYQPAVPAPHREATTAVPEPASLWESITCHLELAEAEALLAVLDDAERAAWAAATPAAGAEYEARLDLACDISRLRGEEAAAVVQLAEARAIAEAEGWGRRELTARTPDRELEAG